MLHAAMMDNVAEGVYLIGLDDLLIKWTNEIFTRMFGYDPGEMVGKQVDIVNAPTERTPAETRIAIVDVLKETGEWHGEVRNIKRNGTHFWCYVNVSLFEHPEYGKVILAVHTDITKRKQAEEEARQKTEDLVLINALSDAVNRGDSLLEILQLLARETKRILSCHGATTYLLSEDREYLVMQIFTRPPAMISRIEKLIGMKIPAISIPVKTGSLYRKMLQEGKPQLINDPKTIQGLMAEFTENKILKKLVPKIYSILDTRSVINVPLVSKGEAIGLLDVSRKEPFTEFDLKRFEVISGELTSIIERKQAEEKVKHLNLVLRAIRNVNQLIVKEKNRERLLKGACNNLVETRGYYSAWIALLDESGKLETYAEAGLGKAFLPIIELLKRGKLTTCSQKALKQQEIVITENPASTCPECPLAQEYSGRGAMTIRLEYNEKVYGLISVSIPVHLAVDQEEQSLFKEVAGDIAFSIHNIELDEERIQAEENVKSAKDELQMILDSVPAIIFYKDTEGRIIRANKALADSLKVTVKDMVGKTTEEFLPKEQAENTRKDDEEVMISGKAKRNIIQPYTTPEGVRWVITDKIPYRDKKGKVTGVIGLSKDITVQRKSEQELKRTYQRLKKTMDAAIDTMSKIIEAKDPYTSGHQHRVCQLAVPLARELGLSSDKIEGIRIASLIHDIGKIGLPTEILSKPTKLTDIEFSLIKGHSQIGYDILKSIDFSYPIAQIVLQHHERLNGSGYPNKLKGDKTLLEAKIIGVADVVEAMSSFRPYRPALGIDKALEEISQNRGILYDPEVVDACLKLFKEKRFKFE
jgi:PAS domain S-box-containing protein